MTTARRLARQWALRSRAASAAGLLALLGNLPAERPLAAQDSAPREVLFDGPFRLPPPPSSDSPIPAMAAVPSGVAPPGTAPALPVQPALGPLLAPYSQVPYSPAPYSLPAAAPSPYQLSPYSLPYPNLPQNSQPQYAPYQPAPYGGPQTPVPQLPAPQNYRPQNYAPSSVLPPNPPTASSAPLPPPASAPPPPSTAAQPGEPPVATLPPPEVVPPPPANAKTDAPILVEESVWNSWGSKVWDPWEGNVELGMNGTDGNSETFNIRLGVTAKHKTETFVQSLQFTTIQKSANGLVTANTALLDGRLEWPMPGSRLNYFIHGLGEYDEFKAFDVRLSGDTGFGYEFVQNDKTTLIGRSGIAFSHEIGGPDDTVHPELLFGGEFKHKFSDTHSVSMKVDYYPDVTEFSDFRVNSQASWEIALAQAWGLSLKLSVIDRYDSTPQGARPNDLDYSTLLLWTF